MRRWGCEMSDNSYEKWKTIETKLIGNITIRAVQLPTGKRVDYVTINYPEAVGVVAITEDKKIVLVGQYRYAVEEYSWEIPMGSLEGGESAEECGKRELKEEAGFTAEKWEKLCSFHPSNAANNQIVHLYLASVLTPVSLRRSEPVEELIKVELFDFELIYQKIFNNEIKDASTIIGVMLLANRIHQ